MGRGALLGVRREVHLGKILTHNNGAILRERLTIHEYRKRLRTTVGASAAPYGYTLSTWTTGAVLVRVHGIPNLPETLGFVIGAVLGFAFVVLVAFGGLTRHFDPSHHDAPAIWGSFHFSSVGLAIGAATLVAYLLDNVYPWPSLVAWPLAGFLYTAAYLLIAAAEAYVAYRWDHREDA